MLYTGPRQSVWNSWRDLQAVQRELDHLYGGTAARSYGDFPAVNIWSNDEKAVLTAELPGIDPQDLDITVKNDVITIRGKREARQPGENETLIRRERETGSFVRSFELPMKVDADNVSAEYRRGILEVTLPRSEADKPRKINVES